MVIFVLPLIPMMMTIAVVRVELKSAIMENGEQFVIMNGIAAMPL